MAGDNSYKSTLKRNNVFYALFLLSGLIWVDEILDIPHLLLNAPSTPVNGQEAVIETVGVIIAIIWLSLCEYNSIHISKSQKTAASEMKGRYSFIHFFRNRKDEHMLIMIFVLLAVLVWLNEILDIPHLMLKAPSTPINSREAIIETVGIVLVGASVLLTVSRSTSASNRLQTELQESKEKFLILSDQSLLSVAILQNGLFKYVNKEFARLLGRPMRDVLSWSVTDFIANVQLEDRRAAAEQLEKQSPGDPDRGAAAGGKQLPNSEYRLLTKCGEMKWVEMFSKPILLGGDKADMLTLIDITDKKIAERTARQHQQQLIQADKLASLGILVSGVAHEINNPNQTIMTYAGLLRDVWQGLLPILDSYYEENGDFIAGGLSYSEVREEMRIYLEGITEGTRSIGNIVSELKEYGRHTEYDLVGDIDVNQVVKAAITLSSNFMKRATRNFKVELAKNLPRIRGNFQRLEQVVINLIENSCQALADRRKSLFISTSCNKAGTAVEIKVLDEGIGIPAENIIHIQDPFFTTKRNSGGTGLGLAISARIIEDHNGSLDFFSESGKGTEAVITLPVAEQRSEGEAS